jgi:hypothetical protein
MLTKLKEIDALGLPATCRFRARVQGDARGPSSTSLKIRQRFQKHLAVALNNRQREDDLSDDSSAPFHLC